MKSLSELIKEVDVQASGKTTSSRRTKSQKSSCTTRGAKRTSRTKTPKGRAPTERARTKADQSAARDRYRQFAHEYLTNGFNGTTAYKAVYGDQLSDKVAASGAWRLLRNAEVQAILAEMAADACKRSKLDEDFVLRHWKAMADANLFDYLTITRDGQVVLKPADELEKLPPLIQQNVKRLKSHSSVRELKDEPKIVNQELSIELVDRLAALEGIAKWLGMFVNRDADGGEDLAQAIRDAEERAIRRCATPATKH